MQVSLKCTVQYVQIKHYNLFNITYAVYRAIFMQTIELNSASNSRYRCKRYSVLLLLIQFAHHALSTDRAPNSSSCALFLNCSFFLLLFCMHKNKNRNFTFKPAKLKNIFFSWLCYRENPISQIQNNIQNYITI